MVRFGYFQVAIKGQISLNFTNFAVVRVLEKDNKVQKRKTPGRSRVLKTEVVCPNDTNPMGILQGGRLVQWMDIAAAVCAQRFLYAGVESQRNAERPGAVGRTRSRGACATRAC